MSSEIWVVDDERSIRWVLEKALTQNGLSVTCYEDGGSLLSRLEENQPDVILSDIRMPGIDGIQLLEEIKNKYPELPVIIMTAHSDLDSHVSSFKSGAFDYIPKPFEVDEAVAIVKRAMAQSQDSKVGEEKVSNVSSDIIGKAPAMQEVFRAIGRLSKSNVTVLINGQSGTGKELVALALHQHSPRSNQIFIPLNMAAIPHDLIESELFGHEKGAFTGADQMRQGRFEQANGGTLFLDEIGDMPAATQTRLLRVLSDGEFYRVGGHKPLRADVRIIAATHQNLENLVKHNKFREDLFHRLNVIRIHIPTLAERRDDIPLLVEHFLREAAQELREDTKAIGNETMMYLCDLPWKGNVRQLENFCRWITVMASGREVRLEDLPPELRQLEAQPTPGDDWEKVLGSWSSKKLAMLKPGEKGLLAEALPKFERAMIQTALKQTGGRKRDASILLGWGRNTLTRKISELGMEAQSLQD
ncbi:MAG: nitrogen regulation protein NR(I) [Candidatus Azotimanducaceae bacterium]|uniref:DNA-binding transcriptional regulator NtrC n=1 Tax=OM182 bacterium TaxID=2510334 RepID=A0A520S283_9GAMM|nr:nitrogen regulation protein NR(I) [Gammaproteobacteria bacterium]OUV67736.1 MAG: nitrogen regulation protein NR(I) [Gammaproteobacteria bacterium TMED133]RZO76582.1 MAG: nitrogen regulation protein NR(I) [OM182 bacterium]